MCKVKILLERYIDQKDGVLYVTLYSPYWMVNQTGFPLDYKPSDGKEVDAVQHPDKIEVRFIHLWKRFDLTPLLSGISVNVLFYIFFI